MGSCASSLLFLYGDIVFTFPGVQIAVRSYYIKALPTLPLAQLYDASYWEGRTSNYEGGVLEQWGMVDGQPFDRLSYYRDLARRIAWKSPSSLLEVGCGPGLLLRELGRVSKIRLEGIDCSPWAVEHRVFPAVRLGFASDLPYEDKEFDLVFSHDLLEHIPVSHLEAVLTELARVGQRNYHIISCGSLVDDRDITHVTMKPIRWWRAFMPDLANFVFEAKG